MITRIWRYLQTMFPVHRTVPVSLLSFAVTWCTATTVAGAELRFRPQLVAGALSFMLFLLLLRVMDEFKDYDIDCRLFPDRPLVTGMVSRTDLSVLGWGTVGALFVLNVWQGTMIFGMFLVCFVYTLLMFKRFFWGRVRDRLLLALITHNPVVFLLQCYIISYHVQEAATPTPFARMFFVAVLFWLPWLTWEIARKIRAPASEDAYETYSQIFGYRRACAIVVTLVTMILAGSLWTAGFYAGGMVLTLGMSMVTAFVAIRCFRFAMAPSPGKAPLRPAIEVYLLAFSLVFATVQFFR